MLCIAWEQILQHRPSSRLHKGCWVSIRKANALVALPTVMHGSSHACAHTNSFHEAHAGTESDLDTKATGSFCLAEGDLQPKTIQVCVSGCVEGEVWGSWHERMKSLHVGGGSVWKRSKVTAFFLLFLFLTIRPLLTIILHYGIILFICTVIPVWVIFKLLRSAQLSPKHHFISNFQLQAVWTPVNIGFNVYQMMCPVQQRSNGSELKVSCVRQILLLQ